MLSNAEDVCNKHKNNDNHSVTWKNHLSSAKYTFLPFNYLFKKKVCLYHSNKNKGPEGCFPRKTQNFIKENILNPLF